MNIGSCNVSPSFSEKSPAIFTYADNGLHVQHASAISFAALILFVLSILFPFSVHAVELSDSGQKKDFYDFEFATYVWTKLNTWDLEEVEWAKYSDVFDPWYKIRNNKKDADALLKTYTPEQMERFKKAHDMQNAFNAFAAYYYGPWKSNYFLIARVSKGYKLRQLKTFDEKIADKSKAAKHDCIPQQNITECGTIPDWRSDEMKKEEQKYIDMRSARLKEDDGKDVPMPPIPASKMPPLPPSR